MKLTKMTPSLVLGTALLLAANAFAVNKGSLEVRDAVKVNGQSLAAGEYQLRWDGSGSSVQLSILKGKKVIATAPAQLVTLPGSSPNDVVLLKSNPDGTKALSEIRFGGKRYALDIADGGAAGSAR
jgi:hypothetical protein